MDKVGNRKCIYITKMKKQNLETDRKDGHFLVIFNNKNRCGGDSSDGHPVRPSLGEADASKGAFREGSRGEQAPEKQSQNHTRCVSAEEQRPSSVGEDPPSLGEDVASRSSGEECVPLATLPCYRMFGAGRWIDVVAEEQPRKHTPRVLAKERRPWSFAAAFDLVQQLNGSHGEYTGSDDVWPRFAEAKVELVGGGGPKGNSMISSKVKNAGTGGKSKLKKAMQPPAAYEADKHSNPMAPDKGIKPKDGAVKVVSGNQPQDKHASAKVSDGSGAGAKDKQGGKPKAKLMSLDDDDGWGDDASSLPVGDVEPGGGRTRNGGLGPKAVMDKLLVALKYRYSGIIVSEAPKGAVNYSSKGLFELLHDRTYMEGDLSPVELERFSDSYQGLGGDLHVGPVYRLGDNFADVVDDDFSIVCDMHSSPMCGISCVQAGNGKQPDLDSLFRVFSHHVLSEAYHSDIHMLATGLTNGMVPRTGVSNSAGIGLKTSTIYANAGLILDADAPKHELDLWVINCLGSTGFLGKYCNSLGSNFLALDCEGRVDALSYLGPDVNTVVLQHDGSRHWRLRRPISGTRDDFPDLLPGKEITRTFELTEGLCALQKFLGPEFVVRKRKHRFMSESWFVQNLIVPFQKRLGFVQKFDVTLNMERRHMDKQDNVLVQRLAMDPVLRNDSNLFTKFTVVSDLVEIKSVEEQSLVISGIAAAICAEKEFSRFEKCFQFSYVAFGAYLESYASSKIQNLSAIEADISGRVSISRVRGVNVHAVAHMYSPWIGSVVGLFGISKFMHFSEDFTQKHVLKEMTIGRQKFFRDSIKAAAFGPHQSSPLSNLTPPIVSTVPATLEPQLAPSIAGVGGAAIVSAGAAPVLTAGDAAPQALAGAAVVAGSIPPAAADSIRAIRRRHKRALAAGKPAQLVGGYEADRARLAVTPDARAYVGSKLPIEEVMVLQFNSKKLKRGTYVQSIKARAVQEKFVTGVVGIAPLGTPLVDGLECGPGFFPGNSTIELMKAYLARIIVAEPPFTKLDGFQRFCKRMNGRLVAQVADKIGALGPEPDPAATYARVMKGKKSDEEIKRRLDIYRRGKEGTLSGRELKKYLNCGVFLKQESNVKTRTFVDVSGNSRVTSGGKPRIICTMGIKEEVETAAVLEALEVLKFSDLGQHMVCGLTVEQLATVIDEATMADHTTTDFSSWESSARREIVTHCECALILEVLEKAGWFDLAEAMRLTFAKENRKVHSKNAIIVIDGRHSGKYITYLANCILNVYNMWWNAFMSFSNGDDSEEMMDAFFEQGGLVSPGPKIVSGDDGIVPTGTVSKEVSADLGFDLGLEVRATEAGLAPFCSTYAKEGFLYGNVAAVILKLLWVKRGLLLRPQKQMFLMRLAAYSAWLKYGDHPIIGALIVAIGKVTAGVSPFKGWQRYTDYWKGDYPDEHAVIKDFPRVWVGCHMKRRLAVEQGGIDRCGVPCWVQLCLEKDFLSLNFSRFVFLEGDQAVLQSIHSGAFVDGNDSHATHRFASSELDGVRDLYGFFHLEMPEPPTIFPSPPKWDGLLKVPDYLKLAGNS